MELEKITDKIIKEAKEKAGAIIKEAEDKVNKDYEKFQETVKKIEKEIKEESKKSYDEEKKKLRSLYNLEKRKEFASFKGEIVKEIFDKLEEKLRNLPKEDYLKWMEKLLDEITFTGEEVVVLDKNDKRLDSSFLKNYAAKRKIKFKLSNEKEDLGGGGFLVKRGNVEFNCGLNVLIEEVKKEYYSYIGKNIFTED